MKVILASFLVLAITTAKAQMPNTEVWLFDIMDGKGTVSLQSGLNISQHKGYDNQPSFSGDGNGIFFTSEQGGKTETMFYRLDSNKTEQLTHTTESEYSPRGFSKSDFKCVRVDKDSSQRIYHYRTGKLPINAYPKSDSIGYFDEADWTLVFFKISKTPTLWLADDGKEFVLSVNPGRCIRTGPDKEKVWFTLNTDGNHVLLYSKGKNISMVSNLPDSAEFFDFWDENTLIISTVKGLQLFDIVTQAKTLIPLPENITLTQITRLAISPDKRRLALVAKEN